MTTRQEFYNALKSCFPNENKIESIIPFLSYSGYPEKVTAQFVVYEDWWMRNPKIVLSKISAILGENERVFARKTKVRRIDKAVCKAFLETNHINGSTKEKYKLGLFLGEELVAVATFSSQKNLDVGRSAELIRFCSKNNVTVVGGLDKLLKFYIREFSPNQIMTYIDIDWGTGNGFLKLGFEFHSQREALSFFVDVQTGKRFRKQNLENNLLQIKNSGSVKLELFV